MVLERSAALLCYKGAFTYQRCRGWRDSGVSSCQPHQQVSPEIARFQGFFLFAPMVADGVDLS